MVALTPPRATLLSFIVCHLSVHRLNIPKSSPICPRRKSLFSLKLFGFHLNISVTVCLVRYM